MHQFILSALLLFTALPALASDALTDEMQKLYAPYRVALFKTNSNVQSESQQAMAQAQQAWGQFVTRFSAKPPAPYDRDPEFANSLAEVSDVYAKAAQEIANNRLHLAHESLERVRDILSALRKRNHVIVYSDHVNAYHAEMERVLIDGPKTLAEPNGMLQLTMQAGTLGYLAQRLRSEAPPEYTNNPEFLNLVQTVESSVTGLKSALLEQNPAAAKAAISKIKPAFSKLFLKFG